MEEAGLVDRGWCGRRGTNQAGTRFPLDAPILWSRGAAVPQDQDLLIQREVLCRRRDYLLRTRIASGKRDALRILRCILYNCVRGLLTSFFGEDAG